ncbi:MAG: DUF4440 domain-containing protein [Fimbriimonadaceae bacterium]|nr:DUF4440 domain-containing protein [Fimbriimonadaceae bacterium]
MNLLDATHKLLDSIAARDWEAYASLCDPNLTCFEAESRGHCVEGLEFHRFYFENGGHLGNHVSTICAPIVREFGNTGLTCYSRLVQFIDQDGRAVTQRYEETRVWRREGEDWKCIHFHRSSHA